MKSRWPWTKGYLWWLVWQDSSHSSVQFLRTSLGNVFKKVFFYIFLTMLTLFRSFFGIQDTTCWSVFKKSIFSIVGYVDYFCRSLKHFWKKSSSPNWFSMESFFVWHLIASPCFWAINCWSQNAACTFWLHRIRSIGEKISHNTDRHSNWESQHCHLSEWLAVISRSSDTSRSFVRVCVDDDSMTDSIWILPLLDFPYCCCFSSSSFSIHFLRPRLDNVQKLSLVRSTSPIFNRFLFHFAHSSCKLDHIHHSTCRRFPSPPAILIDTLISLTSVLVWRPSYHCHLLFHFNQTPSQLQTLTSGPWPF